MKAYKTPYDEHGWRIIVHKGKNTTQVFLRSRYGNHSLHKPFYLRLSDIKLKELLELLKEAVDEELK